MGLGDTGVIALRLGNRMLQHEPQEVIRHRPADGVELRLRALCVAHGYVNQPDVIVRVVVECPQLGVSLERHRREPPRLGGIAPFARGHDVIEELLGRLHWSDGGGRGRSRRRRRRSAVLAIEDHERANHGKDDADRTDRDPRHGVLRARRTCKRRATLLAKPSLR